MHRSQGRSGRLEEGQSAHSPFREWTVLMSAQSGADRVDDAIMTAIDLVADMAKTGDVGKVEIPYRRVLTDDDRANLQEYAQLAGVEITIFPDHVDIVAARRR